MSHADRTTALAATLVDGLVGEHETGRKSAPVRLLEVGIGERTAVAAAIAERNVDVAAIDVVERSVPPGVAFRHTDLVELSRAATGGPPPEATSELLTGLDGLYALRLPPELHGPFVDLATALDVPAAFTTLGGEPPSVAAGPQQLAGGETVYWIEDCGTGRRE
ncbi:UPF0146 family protein [Salinarchaeum chitinilyticum]